MALEFYCPQCNGELHVPDELSGEVIRCGECQTLLRVPATSYGVAERVREGGGPALSPEVPPPLSREVPPPLPREVPPRRSASSELEVIEEPRRPAGRSVAFWVFVVLLTLMLGSCLCCIGLALWMPQPEWRPFQSPTGNYRVELPAPPRPNMPPLRDHPLLRNETTEGTILSSHNEEYRVIHWRVDPLQRLVRPDRVLVERMAEQLVSTVQGEVAERPREVGGQPFPCREFRWRDRQGRRHIARLVVANDRYYLLIVTGRLFWIEPDEEHVMRFFESFEPLPAGKN